MRPRENSRRKSRWLVRALLLGCPLAAVVALIPFGYVSTGDVTFNEFQIAEKWRDASALSTQESARYWWRKYRLGLDRIFRGTSESIADEASFDDADSIFAYVFDLLPPIAVVYPTKTYYYWRFPLEDRIVAGNLRHGSS